MRYAIRRQDGYVRSIHRTEAAARRKMGINQHWRCGTCGSTRKGWGKCSHHNPVCNAEHYNDAIWMMDDDDNLIGPIPQ